MTMPYFRDDYGGSCIGTETVGYLETDGYARWVCARAGVLADGYLNGSYDFAVFRWIARVSGLRHAVARVSDAGVVLSDSLESDVTRKKRLYLIAGERVIEFMCALTAHSCQVHGVAALTYEREAVSHPVLAAAMFAHSLPLLDAEGNIYYTGLDVRKAAESYAAAIGYVMLNFPMQYAVNIMSTMSFNVCAADTMIARSYIDPDYEVRIINADHTVTSLLTESEAESEPGGYSARVHWIDRLAMLTCDVNMPIIDTFFFPEYNEESTSTARTYTLLGRKYVRLVSAMYSSVMNESCYQMTKREHADLSSGKIRDAVIAIHGDRHAGIAAGAPVVKWADFVHALIGWLYLFQDQGCATRAVHNLKIVPRVPLAAKKKYTAETYVEFAGHDMSMDINTMLEAVHVRDGDGPHISDEEQENAVDA